MLLSLCLIAIIPALIVGIFSYHSIRRDIHEKVNIYSTQLIHEIGNNISQEMKDYIDVLDELMLLEDVQHGLIHYSKLSEIEKQDIVRNINIYLSNRIGMITTVDYIQIIKDIHKPLYCSGYFYLTDQELNQRIDLAQQGTGNIKWMTVNYKEHEYITLVRQINKMYSGERLGYSSIMFDHEELSNLYKGVYMGTGALMFMIDDDNIIRSKINKEDDLVGPMGSAFDDGQLLEILKKKSLENGYIEEYSYLGKDYKVIFTKIEANQWFLVSLIPEKYLDEEVNNNKKRIILIVLISLLISILLALILARLIFSPLGQLVRVMKRTKEGDLEVEFSHGANDEIGYLADNFNQMVKRINLLVKEHKENEKKKRELEMQMLQAQIKPHFLFNALNSIKYIAYASQAYSAAEGLNALALLLRSTIVDSNKEWITIAEELANVEHFVTIQKLRYGDRFDFCYRIDPECKELLIPQLLLQPIIENAIIHGMSGVEDGIIEVSIQVKLEDMLIVVKDNGIGMGQEVVDQLLHNHESKSQLTHIGISNVEDRIKLCYGEEYGMKIESKAEVGTKVSILLPCNNGGQS